MYGHNEFSKIISMFLRGELGELKDVDPYFLANIYAMDRWKFLPELQQHIEENDLIILDRYVFSSMAYQSCKLTGEESEKIKNWIYQFEFNFLKLPYPDLNIFLDTPINFLKERLESRIKNESREYLNGKSDIVEMDLQYQEKVRETYLNLVGFPNFKIIPCVFELNGKQYTLTPNEIFKTYQPFIDEIIFNKDLDLNI